MNNERGRAGFCVGRGDALSSMGACTSAAPPSTYLFISSATFSKEMCLSQHLSLSFPFSCVDLLALKWLDVVTTELPNLMTDAVSVDRHGIVYSKRSVILTWAVAAFHNTTLCAHFLRGWLSNNTSPTRQTWQIIYRLLQLSRKWESFELRVPFYIFSYKRLDHLLLFWYSFMIRGHF